MRHQARADSVKVTDGENGWELEVFTDDSDLFTFNIHGCATEFDGESAKVAVWLAEGRNVRNALDVDLDAYAPDDPKRTTLERELEASGAFDTFEGKAQCGRCLDAWAVERQKLVDRIVELESREATSRG